MIKHIFVVLSLLASAAYGADVVNKNPFSWKHESSGDILRISVEISKNSYLYRDQTKVELTDSSGKGTAPVKEPETVSEKDPYGEVHIIYPEGVHVWEYSTEKLAPPLKANIRFQGGAKVPYVCYPPQKKEFMITTSPEPEQIIVPEVKPEPRKAKQSLEWKEQVARFSVKGSASGYMNEKDFIAFIDSSLSAGPVKENSLFDKLRKNNLFISIILILVGGLALNLTPCVLPMIPINVAIIGAGARSGSKLRGFIVGLMYGAGITLVYGLLGIMAILTGSTFGSINSTPYFNFGAGIIFIILSLAMFDVFSIDFSKYMKPGKANDKNDLLTAMGMGGISALLAGACVAPVVIAVLLFSSYLYAQGNIYGLLLPFILGAGMAIPWPFAGAGIAMLPKPGPWMVKVKYAFGVFIIGIAAYYFFVGYSLISSKKTVPAEEAGWLSSLPEALSTAGKENRPLLIDFSASWCKNCEVMDASTLKSPKVKEKLKDFVRLKFRAENPNEPAVKEVLSRFEVLGLPTYVILIPSQAP
ncbi:MAG: cytochrome c biogenesis protein CcdA [Victivallales bacterium]